ncbi:hypothetical protein [Photobacterium leiognathi]|uniref:hypothetical protein n=1 Tax=Photobacterium leiognathi TaxID=553611 RepID=UPI00273A06A2|nr:hypothetical protein [Photobacterium leiognathi]
MEHTLNDYFRHQVRVLLSNLKIALNAHEFDFNDVLKITILIVDHDSEKLHIWSEEMLVGEYITSEHPDSSSKTDT